MKSKSQLDHMLDSYAMSLINTRAEIARVERKFGATLRTTPDATIRRVEGYDEFGNDIRKKAKKMAEFYEVFYALEVSIRQVVANHFHDRVGSDWWNCEERVSVELRNSVNKLQKDEQRNGLPRRSESNIDYLTFGELGKLITSNFDIFNELFTSKQAVEKVAAELNRLRGPIAHSGDLPESEIKRFELTIDDWHRLLS